MGMKEIYTKEEIDNRLEQVRTYVKKTGCLYESIRLQTVDMIEDFINGDGEKWE